jgi:hypothetical protein
VTLSFDGEPRIEQRQCPDCARRHESVTGFVLKDGTAHAVYFAEWYPHSREAYLDVVLGAWHEADYPDQVTFACRFGHVEGNDEPAASLVSAGERRADHPMFGIRLDRTGALEHPRLEEFWEVADWLVINDQVLHDHVYHMPGAED